MHSFQITHVAVRVEVNITGSQGNILALWQYKYVCASVHVCVCVYLIAAQQWADGSWEPNTGLYNVIQAATSTSHPILAAVRPVLSSLSLVTGRLPPTLRAVTAKHRPEHRVRTWLPKGTLTERSPVWTHFHWNKAWICASWFGKIHPTLLCIYI